MNLGVFFIGDSQSGGLYQYSVTLLDCLKDRQDKVIIFNLSDAAFPQEKYRGFFKISYTLRLMSFLRRMVVKVYSQSQSNKTNKVTANTREISLATDQSIVETLNTLFLTILVKLNGVKLNIFTAPTHLSFKLKTPFILPVHDLQHRLNPQFPEVSADGIWEDREYLYSNAVAKATAILVDSEISKEDILKFYLTDEKKVKVLPYVPPNYLQRSYAEKELLEVRLKYHLPSRFLFYPANFWPHKNHKLIIEALRQLREDHNLQVPVVFTGSRKVDYSVFDETWGLCDKYGLIEQIHYLGYVSNEDMGSLYKLADALVMPTFFGSTNIPYVEAFILGCPVIAANIRGVKEQIGDAGLLVDVNSSKELAEAILKIWSDENLREVLRQKGFARIKQWDLYRFSVTLNQIIDEATAA
ncbi:glycosyltransferase family 4 protein [Chloroflexota bacterium]